MKIFLLKKEEKSWKKRICSLDHIHVFLFSFVLGVERQHIALCNDLNDLEQSSVFGCVVF